MNATGGRWLKVVLLSLALPAAVDSLDHAAQARLRQYRDPRLHTGMQAASNLADPRVLLVGMLGIAILDPADGPATVRLAISAMIATGLVVETAKVTVNRPRPHGGPRGFSSSFPSGHTSGAFALAVILARRWKRMTFAFFAVAATVAFSRIYLEHHYLSDVVVGMVVGFVCANIVARWRPATTWGLLP